MTTNETILQQFLERVTQALKDDTSSKGRKIPVSSFRIEVDGNSGDLYAADYFKYLVTGRGTGKAPPPQNMLAWVQDNPDTLARAKQVYQNITENGLAYLIGRKIAKEGTDIYSGKKQGVDLLGAIEKSTPFLTEQIAKNEVFNIATALRNAVKILIVAFLISCSNPEVLPQEKEKHIPRCPPKTYKHDRDSTTTGAEY